MNTIHKRRILKLAAFLAGPVARADARAQARGKYKFNMKHWCGWNDERDDKAPTKVGLTKNLCNTSACALGWATNLWPKQLYLRNGLVKLRGSRRYGLDAAVDFFGLDAIQAEHAFAVGFSRTPKEEATMLRKIAAGRA